MRVLLVEDEAMLAEQVADGLRDRGIAVDLASDGLDGLHKAGANRYDVVILDRDLPEMHGDDVCRALTVERPETRVLMLTAASGVEDRVEGLALGADDYLPKPFAFAELVARVRALGRRAGPSRPPVLERHDITLDPARHEVRRDGELIALSPKEHTVLEVLMEADGAVVSPEELLERAWDEQVDPLTNSVRMVVMTLRRKLGEPQAIVTVPGAGYRL